MELHPDFRDLLAEFVRSGVRFAVIGGLRSADGLNTEQVIGRAGVARVEQLDLPIISIEDLITNKRAAGRPQDLADVALLERVVRRR
jgi:hypothetical protein